MTKIKICGLYREADIDYVNEAGPDYVGFILFFPKSHRNLEPDRAGELRRRLRPGIKAVCVFVDQPMDTVVEAAKTVEPDVIQLHGHETDSYIEELKKRTGLEVWKAFKVRSREDLAAAAASSADFVLLDNGYGTGKTFDWSKIQSFDRPFILAGGLTADNIGEAVNKLRPAAVDLSSGVETDHMKDRDKIIVAVQTLRMQRDMPQGSDPHNFGVGSLNIL